MMVTLLDSYKDLPEAKWMYYDKLNDKDKNNMLTNFDMDLCRKFVTEYFRRGNKGKAFEFSFLDTYLKNGKHQHTVSLYFLGCVCGHIIDENLRHHISKYISNFENLDPYDFKYTWFLTCLYHDAASSVEQSSWRKGCSSDLNFYLGKHGIKYNFFEHNGFSSLLKPYTYSENLVKNYFKYRVEYGHSIDHGIIAGYILYDRLVKNYYEKYEMYINSSSNNNASKPDNFEYDGLFFCKEHLSHFAIISDAIVAHNIWLSDSKNVQLYKDYGLDPLVASCPKLTAKNNPLVFFLDLLDTIEPLKFFNKNDVSAIDVLNNIEVVCDNNIKNNICISASNDLLEVDKWLDKAKSTEQWLKVKCNSKVEQGQTKKITFTI